MGRRKDNTSLRDLAIMITPSVHKNFSNQLLEIVGTKTPNLLRLMLRLCHAVRAKEKF